MTAASLPISLPIPSSPSTPTSARQASRACVPASARGRPKTGKVRVPSLCLHKGSGQGFVEIDGRFIYLGKYELPETQQKYHQLIAEYLASGRRLPAQADDLTVSELLARFWEFALGYYRRPDGSNTGEIDNFKPVIAVMRALYGHAHVTDFGPLALRAVRQKLIERGLSRTTINQLVNRARRIFRWGVSEQLVPATVLHGLQAVQGLKFGRCEAAEPEPVKPAELPRVHAVEPFVSRQVWALIQLQLLTGARSGELVTMRPDDVDRTGKIWVYRPRQHKTRHHGHERLIYLGPRAQQVLRPFLLRPGNTYCFSPGEAEEEHRAQRHAQRHTPMSCGNTPGSNRKDDPACSPGKHYTPNTYHRAIQRGCDRAFPLPEELLQPHAEVEAWREAFMQEAKRRPKLGDMPKEVRERHDQVEAYRAQHRWHPHQLRHSAATFLRKEFGLETARIILGHRSAAVTTMYAEADMQKAVEAMSQAG